MNFKSIIKVAAAFALMSTISNAEFLPEDNPLLNSWHHSAIQTFDGWEVEPGSPSVIVAVMDDGINVASLYPSQVLAPRLWSNSVELNGDVQIDDDNNGYIDDIYGWDFADNDNTVNHDGADHGTRVASVIVGMSPNTTVMAVKFVDDAEQLKYPEGAFETFKYAVDNGAKVINLSWGFDEGYMDPVNAQEVKDGIDYANQHGVLVVAGAGNNGRNTDITPFVPASYNYPNIISVAGTTSSGSMYFNSNYGMETVDVAAPTGVACLTNFNFPAHDLGTYKTLSGTSASTAVVSGLAALLFSQDPSRDAAEVKQIIMATVDPLPSLQGKIASGGQVNVFKALSYDPYSEIPSLSLIGADTVQIALGGEYYEEGAMADDYQDGDISNLVTISGDIVDTSVAGTYQVQYDVVDSDGNSANSIYRQVIVYDPQACVEYEATLFVHEDESRAYSEASGFWWYTTKTWYAVGSGVNLGTNGNSVVTLHKAGLDPEWNLGNCPGEDTTAPIITLSGDNPLTISMGGDFIEPGFVAEDNIDGDITGDVTVTGTVDTSTVGSYQLIYSVSDAAGNSVSVERIVNVVQAPSEWTATCLEHESAGRAYSEVTYLWFWPITTWYAVGSGDNLGTNGSAQKTLIEDSQNPGFYYLD